MQRNCFRPEYSRSRGHGKMGRRQDSTSSNGVTLVEMLISITLTLLLVAAVAQLFDVFGSSLRKGRATVELAGNLRAAANLLQKDLDGLTVSTLPWVDEGSDSGYLEIIEGPWNDATSLTNPTAGHFLSSSPDHSDLGTPLGDIDDILQFTTRSTDTPFIGRIRGNLVRQPDGTFKWDRYVQYNDSRPNDPEYTSQIESPVAEVRWWVDYADYNNNSQRDPGEPYMLMRRALLVRPDIVIDEFEGEAVMIQESDDVAVANVGPPGGPRGLTMRTRMASLGDLSLRQHRYWHANRRVEGERVNYLRDYPYWPRCGSARDDPYLLAERRLNDRFIVLGDVLSFDVRVYDPLAPWT